LHKEEKVKKFWEWMLERGYGNKYGKVYESDRLSLRSVKPTIQMLVGYKIEYMKEKDIMISMHSIGESIKRYSNRLDKVIQEGN